jgi:hypothetical protein
MCAGGSLWFSSFGLVVCTLFLSIVLSRMCRAVALLKGSETCLLQVIFLFTFVLLSIACWSFFFRFFSFYFLSCYYMCVLSLHSSRGSFRTMCGSRTGGWSLFLV